MRFVSIALVLIISTVVFAAACGRAQVPTAEVQVVPADSVTLDPEHPIWGEAPLHASKLILQDLVEPRLMEPSTTEVLVKAITDGTDIAFRLEWADATENSAPGPKRFVDGVAIQLPAMIEPNVPAPQMGEIGKTVQITFWRADWQAIVEGRGDNIASIYPNASVDHYPYEARSLEGDPEAKAETSRRYAPARALGNARSGPREQPVEDLIAEGPSTLSPAPAVSRGNGVRTKTGWAVVIARPLPDGFRAELPSQIAFAVWEGSHTEAGARKMRTGWVPMIMR